MLTNKTVPPCAVWQLYRPAQNHHNPRDNAQHQGKCQVDSIHAFFSRIHGCMMRNACGNSHTMKFLIRNLYNLEGHGGPCQFIYLRTCTHAPHISCDWFLYFFFSELENGKKWDSKALLVWTSARQKQRQKQSHAQRKRRIDRVSCYRPDHLLHEDLKLRPWLSLSTPLRIIPQLFQLCFVSVTWRLIFSKNIHCTTKYNNANTKTQLRQKTGFSVTTTAVAEWDLYLYPRLLFVFIKMLHMTMGVSLLITGLLPMQTTSRKRRGVT